MGIYGTAMHHYLGNLCADAATDKEAARRIIVNEDPLTIAGSDGRKEINPERGHVSVQLPVDGYHAVGMFLPATTIEEGGENLTQRIDDLVKRAKARQDMHDRKNETVAQRLKRLTDAGYGRAGGSAGDHMIELRAAVERGEGDRIYPHRRQ